MENSGNHIFTFTWRIHNWNMRPRGVLFASPFFSVDFLENTEWNIRLYLVEKYQISLFLVRAGSSQYTQGIEIAYSLAAHSTLSNKNFQKEVTNETFTAGAFSKCNFRMFSEHESSFFPNDTLTVKCQMSRCIKEEKTKDVVLQDLKSDNWNSRVLYEKYQFSVRSQVRVSSMSFVWAIKRIQELPVNVKLSTSLPSIQKNQLSFDLSLYLKEDTEEGKRICIEIHPKRSFNSLSVCSQWRIKTVGAPQSIQFEGQDEHLFWTEPCDYSWLFPDFLNMKDLTESYLDHTDGTLFLQIDLSFSTNNIMHIENSEGFILDIKQREISHTSARVFGDLCRKQKYADATLRVRDQEFKVHKFILISRSDVLRQMFESGLKEESGIINIDDLDPDTVRRLLKYLYTEEVEKLNSEDTIKLYYAADKYNIESLKGRLRPRLTTNLSVSTVCKTLVLADTHKDEGLWTSIIDYIDMHTNQIFRSDHWKDFTMNHSSLSASAMQEVFTRKSVLLCEDDSWGGCAQSWFITLFSSAWPFYGQLTMIRVLREWLPSLVGLSMPFLVCAFCCVFLWNFY